MRIDLDLDLGSEPVAGRLAVVGGAARGFTGYAGRMLILSGMALAIAGVPAAAIGWLVERLLTHRVARH